MHSKLQDKQAVQFLGIESEVGQSIIATFENDLQQMDTVYFVYDMSVRTKSSAVIHCLKMMRFPYRFMALLVLLIEISLSTVFFKELLKEWMEQYQALLQLGHHL